MTSEAERRLQQMRHSAYLNVMLVVACHFSGPTDYVSKDKLLCDLRTEFGITEEQHAEFCTKASEMKSAMDATPTQMPRKMLPSGITLHSASATELMLNPGDGNVGLVVYRNWPQDGGWCKGVITVYNADQHTHCIAYDLGTGHETVEWYDMLSATDNDVQVTDQRVNPSTFRADRVDPQPSSSRRGGQRPSTGSEAYMY